MSSHMNNDQSKRILKFFRKYIKELTSTCYELFKYRHGTTPNKFNIIKQLSKATIQSPANIRMIVKQSYKPLYDKSKNKIAVKKDTLVNAQYLVSNWIFIEIIETNQTGFVPIDCLTTININNSGEFLSLIGPCHDNFEQQITIINQSNLSRQISNISLYSNISSEKLDQIESISSQLRILENYQRKFIGDISVLESEIVTLIKLEITQIDWTYIRRGDGQQGFIPKKILRLI